MSKESSSQYSTSEKRDDIDGNYKSNTLDINGIQEELNWKIKFIIKNIPKVIIRFSKQGDPLEKLPWDSNQLSHKRLEKDKTWKELYQEQKTIKIL